MAQLFARIELRGTPSADVYQQLHAHMAKLYWYQTITAGQTAKLPHATYQASFDNAPVPLLHLANSLKTGIETTVWTKCSILVIVSEDWAVTAG